MAQLFFKKHFQDAIRSGTKRTTIRRWNRPMVRVNDRVFSPGLGWLSVQAVETIELEKLDNADALADGFDSIIALRQVLLDYYPDYASDGKQWFRVSFALAQEHKRTRRKKVDQSSLF